MLWHGYNPIHEDGPPIFQDWICKACGARSDLEPSGLFQRVAKEQGIDIKEHPLFKPLYEELEK